MSLPPELSVQTVQITSKKGQNSYRTLIYRQIPIGRLCGFKNCHMNYHILTFYYGLRCKLFFLLVLLKSLDLKTNLIHPN
jgi:hypothetical protein